MSNSEEALHDFLIEFRNPSPEEDTFLPDIITEVDQGLPVFLSLLGYDENHLFGNVSFELAINESYPEILTFDIVAARSVNATPYLSAVTLVQRDSDLRGWGNQIAYELQKYAEASNSHYTVFFSNAFIFIRKPDGEVIAFKLSELEPIQSARIYELLKSPDIYPPGPAYPAAYHPDQTKLTQFLFSPDAVAGADKFHQLETEQFSLDLREFSERLYSAEKADTNSKKGETLEEIADLLFQSVRCLSVRDRNLITKSGEIDLVIEYQGSNKQTLFDYHTQYTLVECKNWTDPVPAKEVGHFESKCVRANVDLGVVFAWNGISGEDTGKHATRMLDTTPKQNPDIVVINSRDLYRILDGTGFYDILDQKLYRQRFDV